MPISSLEALQGWGLARYGDLIRQTARLGVDGQERLERAWASGQPVILTAWHGMTMMVAAFLGAHDDPARYLVIVPNDTRGVTLRTWARGLGTEAFTVSMADESMGGARRLVELMRLMRGGKGLYINPDGPTGPSHEPKRGLAFIARRTHACIVPVGAYAAACYRIPRWDRYTVPLPLARIAIALRDPFTIPPDADTDVASALIRERLNEAEQAAEALYRQGSLDTP